MGAGADFKRIVHLRRATEKDRREQTYRGSLSTDQNDHERSVKYALQNSTKRESLRIRGETLPFINEIHLMINKICQTENKMGKISILIGLALLIIEFKSLIDIAAILIGCGFIYELFRHHSSGDLFSWYSGSIFPWASDSAKNEARLSEINARRIIDAHVRQKSQEDSPK